MKMGKVQMERRRGDSKDENIKVEKAIFTWMTANNSSCYVIAQFTVKELIATKISSRVMTIRDLKAKVQFLLRKMFDALETQGNNECSCVL